MSYEVIAEDDGVVSHDVVVSPSDGHPAAALVDVVGHALDLKVVGAVTVVGVGLDQAAVLAKDNDVLMVNYRQVMLFYYLGVEASVDVADAVLEVAASGVDLGLPELGLGDGRGQDEGEDGEDLHVDIED